MSNSSVSIPTTNDDPSALGLTAAIATSMVFASFAFYLAARRCPKLHDAVYSPANPGAISGAAGFPGLLGAFREVRHSCAAVVLSEPRGTLTPPRKTTRPRPATAFRCSCLLVQSGDAWIMQSGWT